MRLSDYKTHYITAERHARALVQYLSEQDTPEAKIATILIEDYIDAVSDYITEMRTSVIGSMHGRSIMLQDARFNLMHTGIAMNEEEEETRQKIVTILTERINELEEKAIAELAKERESEEAQ